MRARLVKATLECLKNEGYAGASVTKIVKQAGVSRGAHVHHYPTKTALLADAAEYLLRLTYRRLGRVLLRSSQSENKLENFITRAWKDIVATSLNQIYVELLVAGQKDPELAKALNNLAGIANKVMMVAADHYFEPRDPKFANAHDLNVLNHWFLRGMALDIAIATDVAHFDKYLRLWIQMLEIHIKAREGVLKPPSPPAEWDRHWDDAVSAVRDRF